MKKVLVGLAAVLIILASLIFYQRSQVTQSLQELVEGKSYRFYGITLEVPKSEAKVNGLMSLTVDIPEARLFFMGRPLPISLVNLHASRDFWGKREIILKLKEDLTIDDEITVKGLHFELGPDGHLRQIAAASFRGQDSDKEWVEIKQPQVKLKMSEGIIPHQLVFQIESLDIQERREKFQMGPTTFGVEAQTDKGLAKFRLFSQSAGGGFSESKKVELSIKPWNYQLTGQVAQMETNQFFAKILQVRQAFDDFDRIRYGDDTGSKGKLVNPMDSVVLFLKELNYQPMEMALNWEGMTFKEKRRREGGIEIAPIKFETKLKNENGKLHTRLNFVLEKFALKIDKTPIVIEGMDIQETYQYESSFTDLLTYYLRYFGSAYFSFASPLMYSDTGAPEEAYRAVFLMLASSVAPMPDEGNSQIKIKSFQFTVDGNQVEQKNIVLKYQAKSDSAAYSFEDYIELKIPSQPDLNIEGGKLKFKLDLELPLQVLIKMAREYIVDPTQSQDLAAVFAKKHPSVGLNIDLDLGKNHFSGQLNSKFSFPLGSTLKEIGSPQAIDSSRPFMMKAEETFRKNLIQKSSLEIDLQIQRLSKLKKLLEQDRSFREALPKLEPYLVLDEKADTLKFKGEFKEGIIKINDIKRPELQQIIDE